MHSRGRSSDCGKVVNNASKQACLENEHQSQDTSFNKKLQIF